MSIQQIFGYKPITPVAFGAQQASGSPETSNFVKNTFNFGTANLNMPNGIVTENALGDPTRGTRLYLMG